MDNTIGITNWMHWRNLPKTWVNEMDDFHSNEIQLQNHFDGCVTSQIKKGMDLKRQALHERENKIATSNTIPVSVQGYPLNISYRPKPTISANQFDPNFIT